MSKFRKPSSKRIGLKVLGFGETGSGKSHFGLSFPKLYALDSEAGLALYEGKDAGKNIEMIMNTQDFIELEEAIEEIAEIYESDPSALETLVIDSETKFYQNLQTALMELEEKKARNKGRDVMDSNVSVRGWGRIKSISTKLQNLKIDLSGKGVNVVSIAQMEDIKQKIGDNFVVVGHKPIMAKGSDYDYDIVLKFFIEGEGENVKYLAKVLKDRTKKFKVGQVIENATFSMWEGSKPKDGDTLSTSFSKDAKSSMTKQESADEEDEKSVVQKFKELFATLDDKGKKQASELIKEAKIKNPLEPATGKEFKDLQAVVDAMTKIK